MGILGRILQNLVTTKNGASIPESKITLHAGQTIYVERYAPSGDDSPPLPDDTGYFTDRKTTGGKVFLGTIDESNPPVAADGEKRLYSRDSAGAIAAIVFFRNDGTIEINGSADFAVRFNALKTAFDQLVADFDAHTHQYSPGAGAPTATAAPVASTADIDPAKVATVKLP